MPRSSSAGIRCEGDRISTKKEWRIDGDVRADGDGDDDDGCHVLEGAIGDARCARGKLPPMCREPLADPPMIKASSAMVGSRLLGVLRSC